VRAAWRLGPEVRGGRTGSEGEVALLSDWGLGHWSLESGRWDSRTRAVQLCPSRDWALGMKFGISEAGSEVEGHTRG
jgi:hypothetical protein